MPADSGPQAGIQGRDSGRILVVQPVGLGPRIRAGIQAGILVNGNPPLSVYDDHPKIRGDDARRDQMDSAGVSGRRRGVSTSADRRDPSSCGDDISGWRKVQFSGGIFSLRMGC